MRIVNTKEVVPMGFNSRGFCFRYARLLRDNFTRHFKVRAAAAPSKGWEGGDLLS